MAELYLMPSHGYASGYGVVFNQEPPGMMNWVIRELQPFPSTIGARQSQREAFSGLIEAKPCLTMENVTKDNVIMDVQDARFPSFPLSVGINKHSMSHREALQFVNSGSSDVRKGSPDVPLIDDLVGIQMKENQGNQLPYVPSLIYPGSKEKPISDFFGDLAQNSKIVIDSDGRVLITDTGAEMKDLLSIVAEFYLSRNSAKSRKISVPIPYFDRKRFSKGRSNTSNSRGKLEGAIVTPAKSPDMSKLKQSPKRKHGRKTGEERDIFKRNYFHACESLLSILMDKKGQGQTAFLSLKKAGPELPGLLNQFSAGIAGTGLALVLSVICKVACGRVPLCSSKLVSTGFGIGLVWLSWAVNKLGDTVIDISRNSSKLGMKEDDVVDKVDRSVKEIYFRAATLMALAVLRFA